MAGIDKLEVGVPYRLVDKEGYFSHNSYNKGIYNSEIFNNDIVILSDDEKFGECEVEIVIDLSELGYFEKVESPEEIPLSHDSSLSKQSEGIYTGGSSSYYTVYVENPTTEDRPPYYAECNDLIETLKMNYAEANVFKAIWRKCAAQNLGKTKKGYKDGVYDAEKSVFFSERVLTQEKQKKIIDDNS